MAKVLVRPDRTPAGGSWVGDTRVDDAPAPAATAGADRASSHGLAKGCGSARLRNLTPHPITFITAGLTVELSAEATSARMVEQVGSPIGVVQVGPLVLPVVPVQTTARVDGLPAAEPGVLLVVSRMVAATLAERADLRFPALPVRDESGRIVGVRALGLVSYPAADARSADSGSADLL